MDSVFSGMSGKEFLARPPLEGLHSILAKNEDPAWFRVEYELLKGVILRKSFNVGFLSFSMELNGF